MTPLLAKRLGTDRSFERLYRRHVGDVYRYSLAMLRNPADAEDVTQTTFLNAYRAYRRGERPKAAQRWLIAIAHNVCRQRFRQSQRRVDEVAYDETLAEAAVPDPDAPSATEIRRALGHLAFNQRAALVMRELEGRSYTEIAELLDVSTSAVETLIFRARRALREQLAGQLSCPEAELAVSRQLDGKLPRSERGALRAHLRACAECASLARRLRAQRSAIKALGLVPVPASLGSFFGGGAAGGAVAGAGLAAKAAAFTAATLLVAGAGHEASVHSPFKERKQSRAAAVAPVAPVVRVVAPSTGAVSTPAPRQAAKRVAKSPRATSATGRRKLVPRGQVKRDDAAPAAKTKAKAKPERQARPIVARAKVAVAPPGRAVTRQKPTKPTKPTPRPSRPLATPTPSPSRPPAKPEREEKEK